MALWDFLGGAADTLLDKRKRDMAAQLQKDLEEQRRNFQLTLDQKQAERQASRDERQAETDMLNRKREEERYTTERADRQAREAADQAYRNETLNLQRESKGIAATAQEEARRFREQELALRAAAGGFIPGEGGKGWTRDPEAALIADPKTIREVESDLNGLERDIAKDLAAPMSTVDGEKLRGPLMEARRALAAGNIAAAKGFMDEVRRIRLGGDSSATDNPTGVSQK